MMSLIDRPTVISQSSVSQSVSQSQWCALAGSDPLEDGTGVEVLPASQPAVAPGFSRPGKCKVLVPVLVPPK
jgi:hypothetical protein